MLFEELSACLERVREISLIKYYVVDTNVKLFSGSNSFERTLDPWVEIQPLLGTG
jgi:hypothetical protein